MDEIIGSGFYQSSGDRVAVSACMSGTRGSGVLSSTGDVLVRGVGGVLNMCLCFGCGGVGGVGGEWVGGLDRGRERWGGVMSV